MTSTSPLESRFARTRAEWLDRLIASDPGQSRLRSALQTVITIAAALIAERVFVQVSGAMQSPTAGLSEAQAALVTAGNHAMLVIAMMLGAMIGLMATFAAPMFDELRWHALAMTLMPLPMIGGLALGLAIGERRVLALSLLVLILAGGAYLRRFGPWGFFGGQLLFIGDFIGFFVGGTVHIGDLGWFAAEIFLGTAVATLAQFGLFYPSRRRAMSRMRRSFASRASGVVDAALDVLDDPLDHRAAERLRRRTIRLNETGLMIDAGLSDLKAIPEAWTAQQFHRAVFDAEQALANLARFSQTLAALGIPDEDRTTIRTALRAVGRHDPASAASTGTALLEALRERPPSPHDDRERTRHVVMHRFATSVLDWARIAQQPFDAGDAEPDVEFVPSVTLVGGWLPGSSGVSADASTERGPRAWDRVRLAPNVRVAIQMGVAVTAAIVLGSMLSERRFYWAVIAAFVTFMGANNAAEQVRKGVLRIVGTVIGVFVGSIVAHLIGHHTDLAIVVILVSIGIGIYLLRISYAFMVIGITVMVSQLYVQLGEFSNALLRLRLEETALGAAVAVVTVLVVLPLRTGQVVRVAARDHAAAVGALADQALRRVTEGRAGGELRAAARDLDAAHQALLAAVIPLPSLPGVAQGFRRSLLGAAEASRHRARNLLTDTGRLVTSDEDLVALDAARLQLIDSIQQIVDALTEDNDAGTYTYTRTASLFDRIATERSDADSITPMQLVLRDAQLLDGSMAALAAVLGLRADALDTTEGVVLAR